MTLKNSASYNLTLYVSGLGSRSSTTIANLRSICREHLSSSCELEIVDVSSEPERAEGANILITPTLIRNQPLPPRRVVGDLSDTQAVMDGLGLPNFMEGTSIP